VLFFVFCDKIHWNGININLGDRRLNTRFYNLVQGHMQQATSTATGVAVPASITNSATVTQATWRFYSNERVTPAALVKPLHDFAKQQINNDQYVLAAVDWSKLDYKKHTSKREHLLFVGSGKKHPVGYC